MAEPSENILQAHFRIHKSLIFMISCYDIDYAYTYLNNLNNTTFKNYFKIIKTNDPEVINEVYDKTDNKIIRRKKRGQPPLSDHAKALRHVALEQKRLAAVAKRDALAQARVIAGQAKKVKKTARP